MEKKSNPKSVFVLTSLLLAIIVGFGFSFLREKESDTSVSYVDITPFQDGFIAVTNDGGIDWISEKGVVNQTKNIEEGPVCLSINNQQILVAVGQGAIFVIENGGAMRKIDCGSENPINTLVVFRGKIIAGGNEGELLVGGVQDAFAPVDIDLRGNIVSLSAGLSACYGVTDQGEIIKSSDLVHWEIFDFNKTYQGYYKSCSFNKILCTPDHVAVIGENEDDQPVLFFSTGGKVWTERPLIYTDDLGQQAFLKKIPRDIHYDEVSNQHILVCDQGIMMTLPSCSHCNRLIKISDNNLTGISGNGQDIIIVGENNFLEIINAKTI